MTAEELNIVDKVTREKHWWPVGGERNVLVSILVQISDPTNSTKISQWMNHEVDSYARAITSLVEGKNFWENVNLGDFPNYKNISSNH